MLQGKELQIRLQPADKGVGDLVMAQTPDCRQVHGGRLAVLAEGLVGGKDEHVGGFLL